MIHKGRPFFPAAAVLLFCLLFPAAATAGLSAGDSLEFERPGRNIARGKPYTMFPPPNYPHTKHADDNIHLTDGNFSGTDRTFHTLDSTVGWRNCLPEITIDLGRVEPIIGAGFSTAASPGRNIHWPDAIGVLVSEDGRNWWNAGDLVSLSDRNHPRPAGGYPRHTFRTGEMATRGRYVKLVIFNSHRYGFIFCDEIEIYRGPDALLDAPRADKPAVSGSIEENPGAARTRAGLDLYLAMESAGIRRDIKKADIEASNKQELLARLYEADKGKEHIQIGKDFRTVFPLSRRHGEILSARALLWQLSGMEDLSLWQSNRWDPIQPEDTSSSGNQKPVIDISMLLNEVRSEAFNISYSGERPAEIKIRIEGPWGEPAPEGISVRPAVWILRRGGESSKAVFPEADPWLIDYYDSEFLSEATASALPEAERTAEGWTIELLPGITQQVWIMADSRILQPGRQQGAVVLLSEGEEKARVPFVLRVSELSLPEKPTLMLGGWDYTDGDAYSITSRNRENTVAFLQEYHVTLPWGTFHVMPFGKHDRDGRMTEPPSTGRMDDWLALWPAAPHRGVYFNNFIRNGDISNNPAMQRKIREWITFWASHIESKGLDFSSIYLHVFDENHSTGHDNILISHARAIKEAVPGATIWSDPTWEDWREMNPEVLELSDVICISPGYLEKDPDIMDDILNDYLRTDKRLALYSCSGPVRALDPYSYHRLQAWLSFKHKAGEHHFWAFGALGNWRGEGFSSWNEFAAQGTPYAPQMLGPEDCVTAKHMEAIREGLYDYDYLLMLEERGFSTRLSVSRVLDADPEAGRLWSGERDRGIADRVRLDMINLLESDSLSRDDP